MKSLENSLEDIQAQYRVIFETVYNLVVSDEANVANLKIKREKIIKRIRQLRENVSCGRCGDCCRLAISEYSYEELKKKAENGDNYATQFVSVFVPYQNTEDARKINPKYIELLEKNNFKVYYYHCEKVTVENKCGDYNNRPQICREFPDNPIQFLPVHCAYNVWLDKIREMTLTLKAINVILNEFDKK